MPRKAKPHPRSLDALFPKPRKPAVKLCAKGHRQPLRYKPGDWCGKCSAEEREALRNLTAAAEREEWSRLNGPSPKELHIRIVSTGQTITFSIPPHLRKPTKPRLRRRRRKPRL